SRFEQDGSTGETRRVRMKRDSAEDVECATCSDVDRAVENIGLRGKGEPSRNVHHAAAVDRNNGILREEAVVRPVDDAAIGDRQITRAAGYGAALSENERADIERRAGPGHCDVAASGAGAADVKSAGAGDRNERAVF